MISLILPTLGNRKQELERLIFSLNNQSYKKFELIIISQENHEVVEESLKKSNFSYKQVKTKIKGLSAARNIGMKFIRGDIITFTDDDCWYHKDSLTKVNGFFKKNKLEICIFQHIDPTTNKYPKKYKLQHKNKLNRLEILSHASIDIFVNISIVKDYSIGFDEKFGLGAKYNSGEENIYLMDLYKKGYKISYYPEIISYHLNKQKTNAYDKKYFIAKYNLFRRLYGKGSGRIFYLIFLIKNARKFDLTPKKLGTVIKFEK